MQLLKNNRTPFNFGENLKAIRLEKDMTQHAIAYRIGMSQTTYSRIETRIKPPKAVLIRKIAKALNVEPSRLVNNLKDLELSHTPGSESPKHFLDTFVGKIVLFSCSSVLISGAYSAARGFSTGIGASSNMILTIGFSAAFAVAIFIWLGVRRTKRAGKE